MDHQHGPENGQSRERYWAERENAIRRSLAAGQVPNDSDVAAIVEKAVLVRAGAEHHPIWEGDYDGWRPLRRSSTAERDLMCRHCPPPCGGGRIEVKTKRSGSSSKRVRLQVGRCDDLVLAIWRIERSGTGATITYAAHQVSGIGTAFGHRELGPSRFGIHQIIQRAPCQEEGRLVVQAASAQDEPDTS